MKIKLVTGRTNKGFTLLEVMIALVVISLTLSAFIKVSTQYASNLSYLENKTFALWVAQDVASQMRLGLIAVPKNATTFSGDRAIFQRNFQWNIQLTPNQNGQFYRADISVFLKSNATSDRLKSKGGLITYVTYFAKS